MTVLFVLALIIILALAGYAASLLLKVKKMNAQLAQKQAAEQEKRSEQIDYVIESLRVISHNVLHEDLNLSEATLRCKVLLDNLQLAEDARAPYSVLDEVFEQVLRFDTHEERKALTKQERLNQDIARDNIEQKYKSELLACFKLLAIIER